MAKTAKKINKFFVLYASEHIVSISEDDNGLYCEVISEREEDKTYKVHCDESGLVPLATKCECEGHANGYTCKHMQASQLYWNRIYRSNIAKAERKAAEAAKVEPVEEAVVVETPEIVETKLVDISYKGSINGAQHSSGFWASLPSRKKAS